jgi:hypothetical protein
VAAWLRGGVAVGWSSLVGLLPLALRDIPRTDPAASGRLRHAPAIGAGLLLAGPLLLVFGALFASADPVFAAMLEGLLRPDVVVPHVVCSLVSTALAAGYLRHALWPRADGEPAPPPGAPAMFVPVATALTLINVLFLLFVAVQVRYLFGGAAVVQVTPGLTYAEYARRGFFELVAASALVLPLLLAAEWAVRGESASRRAGFRGLVVLLLLLLAVIMASALARMRLYVVAFGLTTPRVYATAGELVLIGVFAWFVWTSLRGHAGRFAWGALLIGLAALAGLHVLSPDAFVARWNLTRPGSERTFDARYAATLGADAAPLLLAALPRLPAADRCVIEARLREWDRRDDDWRSWNLARARARRLVRQQAQAFGAPCPDPSPSGG